MRTLIKIGSGLLLLAFLLIGLSYSMLKAQGTSRPHTQEGRALATENRSVSAGVTQIDLSGPIDLTLRQGAVASLSVRGEQRLLGNVVTHSEGNVLHIATRGMMLHHRHPLKVTLVLPSIDALRFHGSGDSTINRFRGERIDVQLHGSGDIKFNGSFKEVRANLHGSGDMELNGGDSDKVEVALHGSGQLTVVGESVQFKAMQSGSGDIEAKHLNNEQAEVDLNGSGSATITATKSVTINLRGSGDVTVHGNPAERNVNRHGSGEAEFL